MTHPTQDRCMSHNARSSRISGLVNGYISILSQWGAYCNSAPHKPLQGKYVPYTHEVYMDYPDGSRTYTFINDRVTITDYDQFGRLLRHQHKIDIRELMRSVYRS